MEKSTTLGWHSSDQDIFLIHYFERPQSLGMTTWQLNTFSQPVSVDLSLRGSGCEVIKLQCNCPVQAGAQALGLRKEGGSQSPGSTLSLDIYTAVLQPLSLTSVSLNQLTNTCSWPVIAVQIYPLLHVTTDNRANWWKDTTETIWSQSVNNHHQLKLAVCQKR